MGDIGRFGGGMLFAGANSARGFVSFYGDVIEGLRRVYILKGGPGTGKSSFLRSAAEYALLRGDSVEYYCCSSDPDSLDAVVIGGEVAILDGTAPHSIEPELAGAKDEIINLGEFWNSAALEERREEISRLSRGKKQAYALAYSYLSAIKKINDINFSLALPCFNAVKAERAVARCFGEVKTGGGFKIRTAMTSSIGMKGSVTHNTFEFFADKVYVVEECLGLGREYLKLLIKYAEKTDTPVCVSYDPIDIESPLALFFPNDAKAFVLSETENVPDVRVNMKRFVDLEAARDIKSEYRKNCHIARSLKDSATKALERAGEYHFALEKIYVSFMDFDAKEKYSKAKLDEIFG